jgi:hypothetical protein
VVREKTMVISFEVSFVVLRSDPYFVDFMDNLKWRMSG